MKYLKITWNEVVKLLEDHYEIKDISFMHRVSDGDCEICELPEYIEGEYA